VACLASSLRPPGPVSHPVKPLPHPLSPFASNPCRKPWAGPRGVVEGDGGGKRGAEGGKGQKRAPASHGGGGSAPGLRLLPSSQGVSISVDLCRNLECSIALNKLRDESATHVPGADQRLPPLGARHSSSSEELGDLNESSPFCFFAPDPVGAE